MKEIIYIGNLNAGKDVEKMLTMYRKRCDKLVVLTALSGVYICKLIMCIEDLKRRIKELEGDI